MLQIGWRYSIWLGSVLKSCVLGVKIYLRKTSEMRRRSLAKSSCTYKVGVYVYFQEVTLAKNVSSTSRLRRKSQPRQSTATSRRTVHAHADGDPLAKLAVRRPS